MKTVAKVRKILHTCKIFVQKVKNCYFIWTISNLFVYLHHLNRIKCMARRGFQLTVQMRDDLMKTYREVYASCHSQAEAYRKTVKHQAPRYYVSPRQAYNILRLMVQGGKTVLVNMTPTRKRMYLDLFDKLQVLTQRKEFIGKSLWFICQFLVAEPAPEFYFDEESMRVLFSAYRKYGNDYHHESVFGSKKDKALCH